MTLLSIFANDSIAVPLSSGFPANELKYIIENSEALMLLSSEKFQDKAQEVMKTDLQTKPVFSLVDKIRDDDRAVNEVQIEEPAGNQGGMMLYTSGTTSRPVLTPTLLNMEAAKFYLERCPVTRVCTDCSGFVARPGVEVHN